MASSVLIFAIAGLLLTAGSYYELSKASGNAVTAQQIGDCIVKLETAIDAIKTNAAGEPNFREPIDSPNVVNFQRCEAIVREALNKDPNLRRKHPALAEGIAEVTGDGTPDNPGLIGKCELTEPTAPAPGVAGQNLAVTVHATIPLGGHSSDFHAAASLSGGGVSAATALAKVGGNWSGTLTVPGASSKSVEDGAQSTVVVTAAGTTDIPPGQLDGKCPFSLVRVGDKCRFTCSLSSPKAVVNWKLPPKIEATLSARDIDDTKAMLTWETQNSKSRRLGGPEIPGGSVPVGEASSLVVKRGQTDDTYTLTASAPGSADAVASAKVSKVVDSSQLAVTLTSPAGNSTVTSTSVAVTGTVRPIPTTPGSMTASISVNGVPVASVPVDAGGNFAGTAALQKVTTSSNIVVNNPSLGVNTCGDKSTSVSVANTATDVSNLIQVTVSDGTRQGLAAATVAHAVQVTQFIVTWLSCPPLDKNQGVGITLAAGQSQPVGTVDCGCKHSPSGCHASCSVRASVNTSVGSQSATANWTFNVNASCP